jgi:integrase
MTIEEEKLIAKQKQTEEDEKIKVSEFLLDQLYNRPNKELFLKEYLEDDNTRISYCVFMNQIAKHETLIDKDLADWSSEDILDYFANEMTNSHTSMRSEFSIAKQYCNWSVARGINRNKTNPFATLSFKKDILTMLNLKNYKDKFLTEEQVWAMEDVSINYQDTACLIPLFFGLKGSKVSELRNLKEEDIDSVEHTVKLTDDDGSTRVIDISQRLAQIFLRAAGEDIYNRRGKEGFGNRTSNELVDSNYVIRPTTISSSENCSAQSISARCKKLLTDCGYSQLSMSDVYNSGKLSMLKKIKEENGEITTDDCKRVQFEFNDDTANYAGILSTFKLYEKAVAKAE